MNLLVLNVGSSTIKFAVFQNKRETCRGLVDHVGKGLLTYEKALTIAIDRIKETSMISSLNDVSAVVHRVVHGGMMSKTTRISPKVISHVKRFAKLAPLHDIPELKVIECCLKMFKCPQFAVFDTAFHQSMPERAWRYPLPIEWTKKFNVRRFGFHGSSHKYLASQVPNFLGNKPSRVITCHLGNGASLAAIHNGKSVDTSMGWTPLEGVMMGTRCGDIDPAIPILIMAQTGRSSKSIDRILNKESGLKGVCGDSDIRRILKRKDKKARLAIEMFCYRIRKYIGSYAAAMGGLDAIAFTGGIGEHAHQIRSKILEDLDFLGVRLDTVRNRQSKTVISRASSKVKVLVIPTDEERMMHDEALVLLKKR